MKLREVGAAAALAAASILSVVGPPSEQFIYFHDKPPRGRVQAHRTGDRVR